MSTVSLQRALNALFARYDLPQRVAVDGVRGEITNACILAAKKALGYKPAFQNTQVTPGFLIMLKRQRSLLKAQQERGLAWRKWCRNSGQPRARAWRVAFHRWADYQYVSPTGGSAKLGIVQFAARGVGHVAATGRDVRIHGDLLEFLERVLDRARQPVLINCVLNGKHRTGTRHYDGDAADVGKRSGTDDDVRAVDALMAEVVALNEDSVHFHAYPLPGGP